MTEVNASANEHVRVKKSPIHGLGVFAARAFSKGENVLRWDASVTLSLKQFKKLPANEKEHVTLYGGKRVVMQSPEKYVNHSCDPNTYAYGFSDVAARDIRKGEELTSDYATTRALLDAVMKCNCGSKTCRGEIVRTKK